MEEGKSFYPPPSLFFKNKSLAPTAAAAAAAVTAATAATFATLFIQGSR